jgi:hypothetical protein
MPNLSSLTAVPTNVLWEQGIAFVDNTTPWAMSTGGGFRFEAGDEWVNIAEDVDGVHHKIAGADVRVGGNPTFSGRIAQLTAALLAQLSPGAASATDSETGTVTVTPKAAGTLLAAVGDYLENVRVVWPLQGSTQYFIVHFPLAMVTAWTPSGGGKGEKGGVDVTIEARGLAADTEAGTALYKMYLSSDKTEGQS